MAIFMKLKDISRKNRLDLIFLLTFMSVIGFSGHRQAIREIVGSIGIVVVISSVIFLPQRALDICNFFIFQYQDRKLKKIAGIFTLSSWISFSLGYMILPFGFLITGRLFLLAFILLTIIASILTFYDLEQSGNIHIRKGRLVLWFLLPIFFIFTNSLASSYFTQISALDISSVPYTEFAWKFVFSIMTLTLLLQPISYGIFITQTDKTQGYQSATLLALLLSATFMMVAIPHWSSNILASVLDHATRFEWRDEVMCGTLKIKRNDEHYFGFNSDKYTVYFSNADYWGFYELKCVRDQYNNDTFRLYPVYIKTRRPWFNH